MKIMMVTPYFYPKVGGMENYAYNIAKGLRGKHKWDVVVITSNHLGKKRTEEKIDGIKIYRLPRWIKVSNTPINPLWYFQIKRIIKEENPDVINAHTPVPFISDISRMVKGKKPFVLTYQNDLAKSNYFLKVIIGFYYFLIGEKTLKKADKIIVSSLYYAKNSKYLAGYMDKINVVSPGVNLSQFNKSYDKSIADKYKLSNSKVVLFVGQLDKTHLHKGLTYLIDSLEYLPENTKLIIVGKGDYVNSYKAYAHKKDLLSRIIFAGYVKDSDLPSFYKLADVLVLPSYDQAEGFGMTIIESFASKTPAVGTKVGGIPFVIDNNKNGFLVEPKNSKALSNAILKILNNDSLAKKMGENGYEKVKDEFTWEKQISKTHTLFKNL